MNLHYIKDEYGKEILCNDGKNHQIMMEWEKPYMEKSIELLNPSGKVLEIGFGMGYSATKICSFKEVKEYNVIECNPAVWERFEKFEKELNSIRPDLKINLIRGRWEDVLTTTGIYDSIYFDDYILDENSSAHYYGITRVNNFLYKVLNNHTKIGSKISFYSTTSNLDKYNTINCINIKNYEYNIEIPENCKYAHRNNIYIQIFTKTTEAVINLKDKLLALKKETTQEPKIYEQMKKEMNNQKKNKNLFNDLKLRKPSCGLIVIDNFYNNPYETRTYILTQEFKVRGNYPGQRTVSYANSQIKEIIQDYVMPFGGKITEFPMPDELNNYTNNMYNGAFQYTTSRDRSWVHVDGFNNWAGVLYMTPNAPVTSGTAFYKFNDGTTCEKDMEILNNKIDIDNYSQDMTKWQLVDRVGNVFNRLILFNSKRFHMSMDYFGDSKENGRLFQVFFFSTER